MSRSIVTGIDIGTFNTKVLIVDAKEKNEKGLPKILGLGIAESHGLHHGYVTDIKDVSYSIRKALSQAEEKAGVKVKSAYIGISGIGLSSVITNGSIMTSRADAEVTDLDMKKLEEQAIKDIPKSSINNRDIIYQIPLEYKIDGVSTLGSPLGLTGNKFELKSLFVTCMEHHKSELIEAVNGAGIKVDDVIAGPIASGYVILNKTQKMAGCVLANIGAETVSIAVFENGIPTSLEVFPIGGSDITNDIALGLRVPLDEAEAIKIGAVTGSSYPRKKLDEIINARLGDIFDLIEGHLKKIGRNGLLPAGIILTGGGAGLSSIESTAKVALKLPAKIGSVVSNNSGTSRDVIWAVAYGLCMIGTQSEEGPSIDPGVKFFKDMFRAIQSWLSRLLP